MGSCLFDLHLELAVWAGHHLVTLAVALAAELIFLLLYLPRYLLHLRFVALTFFRASKLSKPTAAGHLSWVAASCSGWHAAYVALGVFWNGRLRKILTHLTQDVGCLRPLKLHVVALTHTRLKVLHLLHLSFDMLKVLEPLQQDTT